MRLLIKTIVNEGKNHLHQLPVYRSGCTGPAVVVFVSVWSVVCVYVSGAGIAVHIKALAESSQVKSVLLPDESYKNKNVCVWHCLFHITFLNSIKNSMVVYY